MVLKQSGNTLLPVFFKERLAAVRAHRMQGSKEEGGGGSGEGDAISDSRIGGYRWRRADYKPNQWTEEER
jgi:hypothetical protein